MNTLKTLSAALLASAVALPAFAGDRHGEDHDGMKAKMKTTQSMKVMDNGKYFDAMDLNRSADIDFTEFSNYMETKHGWDAGKSAQEYVRLTGGSSDVITDRSFAGLDIARLPHKHMDGTKHNMSAATTTLSQPTAVMSRTVTAEATTGTPMMRANYGAFADYDMNRDGRVDFNEYSKYRSKSGIRTTQAAQEFIRFSDGQSDFDETRFTMAASEDVINRPYYRAQASNSVSYTTSPTTTMTTTSNVGSSLNYNTGVSMTTGATMDGSTLDSGVSLSTDTDMDDSNIGGSLNYK